MPDEKLANQVEIFLRNHAVDFRFFIKLCENLTRDQIWMKPPAGKNAFANILCHIVEMERFWIDWGLGGEVFERHRDLEFERKGDLSPEEISASLKERCDQTAVAVRNLPEEEWLREREFHNDILTGHAILVWHARHLGIHRGQLQMRAQELYGKDFFVKCTF